MFYKATIHSRYISDSKVYSGSYGSFNYNVQEIKERTLKNGGLKERTKNCKVRFDKNSKRKGEINGGKSND